MIATWAGTHVFRAPALVDATTVEAVQRVVREGGPVRALGTRHSFHDLADTTGTLVSVTAIPFDAVLDVERREVTVGAGARYGVLAAWLEERGWALHNLGSLPHISIGGATATGTHGSGDGNGGLATAVRAFEYVDATGDLVRVERSDADFPPLAVGLGAFGIVTRLTLAVQPTYLVRQTVTQGQFTWDELLADPEAVTGSAYSVSVFTTWTGDVAGDVWRKSVIDPREYPLDGYDQHRVPVVPLAGSTDNLTRQNGAPGPWCEQLPHFRLDSEPSFGDEIQSEYFVPRGDAAAALTAVRALAADLEPHLVVSELRTVAADDLWLSGAFGRDTLAIHFTWRNHPEAVRALLPRVEAALAPFGARPHWGKWHTFDAESIARVVPRLTEARAVFDRLDPEGRFANDHLRRLGVR